MSGVQFMRLEAPARVQDPRCVAWHVIQTVFVVSTVIVLAIMWRKAVMLLLLHQLYTVLALRSGTKLQVVQSVLCLCSSPAACGLTDGSIAGHFVG
jgi:hypothetical protein